MKNIEQRNIIKFYRATKYGYGFLSCLYKKVMFFEGREFPSAEYAYQFAKFKDETVREWAMEAPKPHLLAILAHGLFSWDIVSNWSEIKVQRMYNVLCAKFSDRELMYKLLDTGDSFLIENSKSDAFWGIGKNQKGKNMLGVLLMRVREEIKEELNKKC